ncbi:hypothetical protein [Pediococcus cellicola]|nr:hypothetical protein [Pediococcus cellicola]GEL14713.1 hypothetical protein PCE01_05150 [Pediococcus cellicola]
MRKTKNALLEYLLKNVSNADLVNKLLVTMVSRGQIALVPASNSGTQSQK